MKKMKMSKTSKNDGLPHDFFRRAKRAGKIAVLGLAEKKHWLQQNAEHTTGLDIMKNTTLAHFYSPIQ